jgi:serine/threonine protein kinase
MYGEMQALREMNHPNIVNLIDTFSVENEMCVVMEYCSGGELKQYLEECGALPESEVYSIATQLVEGVRHSHNAMVIHRDLKLENILFSDKSRNRIKIVDFGISGCF